LHLEEYLRNDPPCQLPCWGGITPGKSNLADAQNQLATLSGISDRTFFGEAGNTWIVGTLLIPFSLENTVVGVRAGYVASHDSKMVILNGISALFLPKKDTNEIIYDYPEYNTLLSAYTLPHIFKTYGLPNLIYARADINDAEPTASDYFIIRLLYLDLGIFISYTMPMREKEEMFQFCPSESLIDLELTSNEVGRKYEDFFRQLGVTEWATLNKTHHQLLEDATGMTNEEFSQTIISSPETCFESPIKIWTNP